MALTEIIKHKKIILALIVKGKDIPDKTSFITPNHFKQQVGFICYDKNQHITPHIHNETQRKLKGTSEVLILKKGHVRVDFYSNKKLYVKSKDLSAGDILILVSGGHGFYFYKKSTFIEIKQGPYAGEKEKIKFKTNNKGAEISSP